MINRAVGAMSSVAALGNGYDFVSDSQDVESIRSSVPGAQGYDSFFVIAENGDYVQVWGMCGIIPYLSKLVSRLA